MDPRAQAFMQIAVAVAEAIRSLGSVPNGELYARVMDKLTLEQYNLIIEKLKTLNVVTEHNNLLTWSGK